MDKILQQGAKINIFSFSRLFKGLGLLEIQKSKGINQALMVMIITYLIVGLIKLFLQHFF